MLSAGARVLLQAQRHHHRVALGCSLLTAGACRVTDACVVSYSASSRRALTTSFAAQQSPPRPQPRSAVAKPQPVRPSTGERSTPAVAGATQQAKPSPPSAAPTAPAPPVVAPPPRVATPSSRQSPTHARTAPSTTSPVRSAEKSPLPPPRPAAAAPPVTVPAPPPPAIPARYASHAAPRVVSAPPAARSGAVYRPSVAPSPAPAPAPTQNLSAVDAFRKMREEFAKLRAMKEKRQAELSERSKASATSAPTAATATTSAPSVARGYVPPAAAAAAERPPRADTSAPPTRSRAVSATRGSSSSMFGMRKPRAVSRKKKAFQLKTIDVEDGVTVREYALRMGAKLSRVMAKLEELGETVKEDGVLDPDIAEIIVADGGHKVRRVADDRRDRVRTELPDAAVMAEKGYPHRAPVVTVMGHVDHGKTTLLDALRGTNVAEKEAGGITQGVAVFSVPLRAVSEGVGARRAPGGKAPKAAAAPAPAAVAAAASNGGASHVDVMTFMDTPGHALFASMRARGAAVTDVVVLVVDGKDGVMPQTKECVRVILEAGVTTVVAVTKVDTCDPAAACARVSKELLELGFATEAMGGDAPVVPVSARTGVGLQELKDAIALQAEMLDLRADAAAPGEAVIVDARTAKGQGIVADCVVRWGTLRVGDFVVAGDEYGRVKALITDAPTAAAVNVATRSGSSKAAAEAGELGLTNVTSASAGVPVRILGLRGVPPAGVDVLVVENETRAKNVVEGRKRRDEVRALLSASEADAVRRAADREEYTKRRQRKAAYDAAIQRERRRHRLRVAGAPLPPELAVQPWETVILQEAIDGKIAGVGSTGRNLRAQGDQQRDVGADGSTREGTIEAAPKGPHVIPFVVRAESSAAVLAVQDALARVPSVTKEVTARVVNTGVGEVTETDVQLAADMGATIIAFNARVPAVVSRAADRLKARIVSGRVIYHLLDEVCGVLAEHMESSKEEETVSVAEVKQVFELNSKKATPQRVAGCVISEGAFPKSGMTKYVVLRDGAPVAEVTALASLMHIKEKIEVAKKGQECGMQLDGFSDFVAGDRIAAIRIKMVKPKLTIRFD